MIQMIHFASLFLFTDPAPTWTYTLSLHDALPIFSVDAVPPAMAVGTAVLIVAIYVAGSRSALRRGAADRSAETEDRKSTRLNSSHVAISYAVFCLKKKKKIKTRIITENK